MRLPCGAVSSTATDVALPVIYLLRIPHGLSLLRLTTLTGNFILDTTMIGPLPPMHTDHPTEPHDPQLGLIATEAIGHPLAEDAHRLHTPLILTLPHPEVIDLELVHLGVVRGALQREEAGMTEVATVAD